MTILEEKQGFISLLIDGKDARKVFGNEAGGHRWQTVSPTDKKGRVHTSTVTVSVLEPIKINGFFPLEEIEYKFTRGTGPGGQFKNKVETCVVATHLPTKISVRIDSRSQSKNKEIATQLLIQRVRAQEKERIVKKHHLDKKAQVGSGMRGDKRRTYRSKDDSVVDHITGMKWRLSKWMRGDW